MGEAGASRHLGSCHPCADLGSSLPVAHLPLVQPERGGGQVWVTARCRRLRRCQPCSPGILEVGNSSCSTKMGQDYSTPEQPHGSKQVLTQSPQGWFLLRPEPGSWQDVPGCPASVTSGLCVHWAALLAFSKWRLKSKSSPWTWH